MDPHFFQIIFQIVVGIAAFFGAFILKNAITAIREIEQKMGDLPKTYVLKSDYVNDIHEIKSMLREIYGELRTKADRNGN